MELKVTIEIKQERILDLLTSALEGGSNYWYNIGVATNRRIKEATKDMEDQPFVDRLFKAVELNTPKIFILDLETGERLGDPLTPKSWQRGLEMMSVHYPQHFANFLSENDDADTGDVFFQLALMGELVYG